MTSPARKAAKAALQTWRQKGTHRFPSCIKQEDTRLAERIYYGVLQNERFLDACIAEFSSKAVNKMHPVILDILRMSVYQILFLDRIPESAIVHDAVELCQRSSFQHASGFVNAVLHQICSQKERLLSSEFPLGIQYSHPDWLIEHLTDCYDISFVRAFLEANQKIPTLRVQVNTLKITLDEFLLLLNKSGIRPLTINRSLSSVELESTSVEGIPGYESGFFYIQDDAARSAVRFAEIYPGMNVLDVCAAPGGKCMAAALDGANVTACDSNIRRLRACRENFSRLQFDISVNQMDATVWNPKYRNLFDCVIADVPCSGTGVIRKHPEIRKRTEHEVQQLIELQKQILDNVSGYVRDGGLLLYSTCSVLPDENEIQVNAFLSRHHEFALEKGCSEINGLQQGIMRTWPQQDGNDGFFAVRLRKIL